MNLKIRNCGLAAILAVVLFSISVGYFLNSGQAAYTPANPVIASWDVVTDIPKNISTNGTWITDANDDHMTGMSLQQSGSGAQNDALRWSVVFPDTAPHTLYVRVASIANNRGIATVSLDMINQSTIDFYSAASVPNEILSISITPQRVGLNTMQFWMATKNPSSSGYFLPILEWWII